MNQITMSYLKQESRSVAVSGQEKNIYCLSQEMLVQFLWIFEKNIKHALDLPHPTERPTLEAYIFSVVLKFSRNKCLNILKEFEILLS